MKTIEERAWEKYPEVIKHHNLATIDINEEKRKMYIEIATEHYDSVCVPKIDMVRERNKPTQSWMERAKIEIEHEEELTIERAYELGKIRGEKEQKAIDDANLEKIVSSWKEEEEYWIKRNKKLIDKACKWVDENVGTLTAIALRKAMEK